METNTHISKTPPFLRMAAVCFAAVFAVAACSDDSSIDNDSDTSDASSEEDTVEEVPVEGPYDIVGEEVAAAGQQAQRDLLEERDPSLDDLYDAARSAVECADEHDASIELIRNIFDTERPFLTTAVDNDDFDHASEVLKECSNAYLDLVKETYEENAGPAVPEDDAWQMYTDCLDSRGMEYDSDATNIEEAGVEADLDADEYPGSCEAEVRQLGSIDDLAIDLS